VLGAAGLVKQLAGQINMIIHALGILLCLPHILRPSEIIDYVSLGAGNTGAVPSIWRQISASRNSRRAGVDSSKLCL
jgi:hypothetical protein